MADLLGHNPEKIGYELEKIKALQTELEETVAAGAAFKLTDLKINGNNLKSLGYEGKEIGEKLNELLALVVDDKLENTKEKLIEYLNKKNVER